MRNIILSAVMVILLTCAQSSAKADWPAAYLKFSGKPDISQVNDFENTLLKAKLVEIRLRSGESLDIVVEEKTMQIVMMVARNVNMKESGGSYLRNVKRTKGWQGVADVELLEVPIYSLLATADRLSIDPWRVTYTRFGDTDWEKAKNYSFLVFRVKDWNEAKTVVAEYFHKAGEDELMIDWYPANHPRSPQWMTIEQVDELLSPENEK